MSRGGKQGERERESDGNCAKTEKEKRELVSVVCAWQQGRASLQPVLISPLIPRKWEKILIMPSKNGSPSFLSLHKVVKKKIVLRIM